MGKVSIIVPVYNREEYLEKCVKSIMMQSYSDIQIVLVDDGSTDSSLQICRKFEKSDRRVLVIQQKNRGVVSARQAGLSAADGEWVAWVDSDDWIEPDYIDQLVSAQLSSGADLVAAGFIRNTGKETQKQLENIPVGTYDCKSLLPQILCIGRFFEYGLYPALCTKLFSRKPLYKAQMAVDPRICLGDDAAVVYPCVLETKRINITDICGYHYVQHPGSLTKVGDADEPERIRLLIEHLEHAFRDAGVWDIMRSQLKLYQKYLLLLRRMPIFDQQILLPFGGIPYHSRVVIYGAGVIGQQIRQYLVDTKSADILLWVDRNAVYYQNEGLPVCVPEEIPLLNNQFDYVLVANIAQSSADSMREYLLQLRVPAEKIRWFSQSFLGS